MAYQVCLLSMNLEGLSPGWCTLDSNETIILTKFLKCPSLLRNLSKSVSCFVLRKISKRSTDFSASIFFVT